MEPSGPNSSICSTVSDNFQIIHNIHNQDLANRESQNICNQINNDLDFCSPNPLHRNLILAGDFNISTVPGRCFSYASPVPMVEANFSNSDRGNGSKLEKLLADVRLVEVDGGVPTRYCKATDSGATIDRILTNLSQWIFPTSKWAISILGDPKKMHLVGISDHSVLKVSATQKKPSEPAEAIIPVEIFKHKMFSTVHEQLCWETNLGAFRDPWLKLEYHKTILRAAGQFVKEYIQDNNENIPFAKVLSLSTLAKVIWTQSFALANNLLEYSQLAKAHIAIGESEITIRSHIEFTTASENAKSDLLHNRQKK